MRQIQGEEENIYRALDRPSLSGISATAKEKLGELLRPPSITCELLVVQSHLQGFSHGSATGRQEIPS